MYEHRHKKHKEELKRVHERNFENSRNFPRNFQSRQCGLIDNPSAFIEKGNKVNS